MSPGKLYIQRCNEYGLIPDSAQKACLRHFDRLWHELNAQRKSTSTIWHRIFRPKDRQPIKGIYIWGSVGRGKTMLMDIFYASINTQRKQRQHFHSFMLSIHKSLQQHKKSINPLKLVARDIAEHTEVLCLDEFHVNDITDAMLLGSLLSELISKGVVLVTTSNFEPEALYADGLQRAQFIPAIQLLNTCTQVIKLSSDKDYRLQNFRKEGTWHQPLDSNSAQQMLNTFNTLSSHTHWAEKNIEINGRKIEVLGQAEGAVWFEFKTLCDSPRSQSDYIEIACQHHSVLLSNLPLLTDNLNDAARRLLNMLDIFYEHRVKLVVSAAGSIDNIYTGERLAFEFKRAKSRLFEMQSEEYLAQTHR